MRLGLARFPAKQWEPHDDLPSAAMTDRTSDMVTAAREADAARALRARRDADLTPEERLERVHELCRQLAAIKPAPPRKD